MFVQYNSDAPCWGGVLETDTDIEKKVLQENNYLFSTYSYYVYPPEVELQLPGI